MPKGDLTNYRKALKALKVMKMNSKDMPAYKELSIALEESVKLQSHYAKLLNDYDGGFRIGFNSGHEWIARLKETGTIK